MQGTSDTSKRVVDEEKLENLVSHLDGANKANGDKHSHSNKGRLGD
jgi:hypothetical protein